MIIAVWGSPGSGKSLVATELGRMFARDNITVVVNTDMTQPTIPVLLPKIRNDVKHSLGVIFPTPFVRDAQNYLHQHPKEEKLFLAGLKKDDDYLSYEVGVAQYDQAYHFINACSDIADVVVLDCSNQRGDPFFAAALDVADMFIITMPPDIKNVCWYLSVKELLENKITEQEKPLIRIANPVMSFSAVKEVESLLDMTFDYKLPFSKQLAEANGKAEPADSAPGLSARKSRKVLNKLFDQAKAIRKGGNNL